MNNKKSVRSPVNKARLWNLPEALKQYGRKNLKNASKNPQPSSVRLKTRRDGNPAILNFSSSPQESKK